MEFCGAKKCKLKNPIKINHTFLFSILNKELVYKSILSAAWLSGKRRAYDQHGLDSKPTSAILLCPWERHFMALSPAWGSWQAVLNYNQYLF